MSKKKKYIILLLITLVLATVTTSIYLFVNPNTNNSTSYTVDKYTDVNNWCDTSIEDSKLTVDCKALLINIDVNGCFEVQVITKDKGLKDLTVCEKNDTLSYTNEVLGYKKLMPVDMVFAYSREEKVNNYTFSNVSFDQVDDTYIQNIVNEDIANLVTIDPSTTTIENSVDFCPKPETLPKYVSVENQLKYTEYKNNNGMKKDKYLLPLLSQDVDNTTINNRFLICDSSTISSLEACNSKLSANFNVLPKEISSLQFNSSTIAWGNDLDGANIAQLNRASIIYDGLLQNNSITYETIYTFNSYIENFSSIGNPNEKNICLAYKILNVISDLKPSVKKDMSYIEDIINMNITNITSSICYDIMSMDLVDKNGLYLRIYFNNKDINTFEMFERCNNLNKFTK